MEQDFISALILFCTGLAAGFINVTAGGGSTLTLPALIFLGLDTALANGTNRIAIIIQNIAAITSFRQEKYARFKMSLKMGLLTIPGGIVGAVIASRLDDATFKLILGIIMIGVIISMLIPRAKIKLAGPENEKLTVPAMIALFAIGFYGGFIQVGVGFLLMAAIYYLVRLDLVNVNMHKVFIIFLYTVPALIIFIATGNVDWFFGLSLAAGNAIGGWWAAKIQVRKGEKFIRWILIIAILIMAAKLFGIF